MSPNEEKNTVQEPDAPTMPYTESGPQFQEQFSRLLTVWQTRGNIKTAGQLLKQLNVTPTEYIRASHGLAIPDVWLIKTVELLQCNAEWILTGKTNSNPVSTKAENFKD